MLRNLCLLTGLSYERLLSYQNDTDYIHALKEAGQQLQQATGANVIITGLNPPVGDTDKRYVGNMFVDSERSFHNIRNYNGESYSGTGDLFASIIMGGMMRGQDLMESMTLAETFLATQLKLLRRSKYLVRQACILKSFKHLCCKS